MLTVNHINTFGWEGAFRGMRNPKNSWDQSDSGWKEVEVENLASKIADMVIKKASREEIENAVKSSIYILSSKENAVYEIGPKDMKLATTLANAGDDHGKFLRMITVQMDICAPLYWWKEFDTYKVGTVADSCSTMHKIHSKEFTLSDFSVEHLHPTELQFFEELIKGLNYNRDKFNETKDKEYWWQLIQGLPTSYNQTRTVQMNYQVLKHMYHARKNHKLDEWHQLCDVIETLPYAKELIIGG